MVRFIRRCVVAVMLLSVLAQASCLAQTDAAERGFRDYKDQQGRAIKARVVRVDDDRATIEREDGKRFTVPVSIFSQADQDHIRGLASGPKPSTSSDDWARFRGPSGMGTSDATGLPVTWSDNENVVWKTALPGPGASSPIVFGDRIYVTCYTGYFIPGQPGGSLEELKRHLIALRKDTGEIIWDEAVPAKLPEETKIRDHGYAANTPAADADGVYVFHGKSGVFAYDHDGGQLWQADVGSKTNGWGTSASPVLYKDMVFINASVESESLVALDRRTGEEKWQAGGIRQAWNTPLVITNDSGDEELVVAIAGKVLAFGPDSGDSLWTCDTDITWYMVPSAVTADGIVYYLGGRSGVAGLAVRAGGSGDVTATHRLWTSKTGSNVTSPIYHDGHLYWMHEKNGIAYCAKPDTGYLVYEERIDRAGQIYASPLLAEGRIYYLNRSGRAFVVGAKPQFDLLATNELDDGSQFNGSPAVTGNRILVRSDKYLYCLGR
ncbi:MAG: PQQ-binding-like beta-propeller repeat protein [Planctomycetes bacterium]|nr:PQQ-binding-like beta-propeller repeat protein [Planctomycetota bacterium]MBL7039822.1 PQQ-binding-like beta-propeller repeat protein [Pirellulaceae bacterium]